AYVRAKQIDKAVAFLHTVLKANPANAQPHILLGSIKFATNQPDEAFKDFSTAIATDPKDVNGYRALANFYLSRQNIDAAQNTIRDGLKQQPGSEILHLMLANTLELKGNFEGAIAEYESMRDRDPRSLVAANNLASLLADHRTDQASLERAQSVATVLR